ncbi:hypothetical protein [Citrobacter amalonaticus]|uniref:hypothetical protein n=1 Tax=Citrobacter amalonaticus TaxID=35703 RepID=UPI000A37DC0C|nr:hypothetical protein [Citrobacter amalonaticus]OUE50292.1 hypothetical protein AZ012_004685 [Citrobacter amalonaticus]
MTFQEWVDENGGQIGIARHYEFNASLVGSWYRYERFPRTDNLNLLIAYSEGKINVQQWAAEFAEHRRKQRKDGAAVRQKRIKGNLPVNTLPRLKALFSELGMPAERCNLRGPRYLARWKHSNVTVLEVRNAIAHLEEIGKDAGDIDLIHKEINGARRAAIGRLEE